ncbi:hypothetical protein TNCV_4272351 [Trichonephila clavipes]|nr:hypothetical protein TNCV_4272351 [Trichonephila clavipes]
MILGIEISGALQDILENCGFYSIVPDESTDIAEKLVSSLSLSKQSRGFEIHKELLEFKSLEAPTKGTRHW